MFHGEKKDGVKEKSGSLLSRIDDARNVLVATKLRDGGLFSWPENTENSRLEGTSSRNKCNITFRPGLFPLSSTLVHLASSTEVPWPKISGGK